MLLSQALCCCCELRLKLNAHRLLLCSLIMQPLDGVIKPHAPAAQTAGLTTVSCPQSA
jgi:hypothetical protein